MTRNQPARHIACFAAVLMSMAACGGGSDSSGDPDRPPVSSAGADQSVTEGLAVQLVGSGSGSDTPLTFEWTQISGTSVTINAAQSAVANFMAPGIASGSEILTFRLAVTDAMNRVSTDDISVTINDVAPGANAGSDRGVANLSLVQLNGAAAGSDTPLTIAWIQIAGPGVVINNPGTLQADFTSPDVGAMPEIITLRLTVTDATGRVASDDIDITVTAGPSAVSVFGKLEYESPTPAANCDGINFNAITLRAIRGATVQLINSGNQAVLQTTVSDNDGNYLFANADPQLSVFVRVLSESKKTGTPAWNIEVRNNTANTMQPLGNRPRYALDGPTRAPGGADDRRDMLARTGWSGPSSTGSFTGVRSAAPFSVLDTMYSAVQLVLTADSNLLFPPLDAYWSVNNTSASGDIDIGEIGTSFYRGFDPSAGVVASQLFLLGKDGDDIEEFDDHVIAHEWGHYFEDNFSRSDSIGGQHGSNDRLDPRVAFGEGWATALSGMILNNNVYCDAFWAGSTLRGFDIQIENEFTGSAAGWYNENSVMKILYDLWDTDQDGIDTSSLGFGSIYSVMRSAEASTTAFTTLFSFMEGLKAAGTGQNPFIDDLLASENIVAAGIDRWATGETNSANSANTLPVYQTIEPNGTPVKICSSAEFDGRGQNATGNKLNIHRFLRLDIVSSGRYTFDIQADAATLTAIGPDDPNDVRDQSDPDMYYYRSGAIENRIVGGDEEGTSGIANSENFTSVNIISPGTYVIDFLDWRYEDTETATTYPESTCFDFTILPSP